jgi:hypothetical protein
MAAGAYLLLPAQKRPECTKEHEHNADARNEPYIAFCVSDRGDCDDYPAFQALIVRMVTQWVAVFQTQIRMEYCS